MGILENKIIVPPAPKLARFNNGHWRFDEQMGGTAYLGFIYVVHDTILDRYYLGKKNFRGMGVSNRGKESDWRKYKSSSKLLEEMFLNRPNEEFEFTCIEQYKTRSGLSYAETWSLCFVDAPLTKRWYNKGIEKVSWNVSEKVTKRHIESLLQIKARIGVINENFVNWSV